jgi:signal peptidase II
MTQLVKEKILPFSLTAFVIALDQVTKAIIVHNWPKISREVIFDIFGNDILRIIHVRNPAIAFSLGNNLPEPIKPFAFIVLPILVLGFLIWYFLKSDEFSTLQRWALAGIIGGGLGNIIDRIFRPEGVVDFIDVKFFGIFGMDRWPTFNFADSSVVVCCILLFITLFIPQKKSKEEIEKQGAANEQKS